ncbi:unnamed protein product [Phytomonas sp. EM1]|nr:unnamed protein product [Phytomonas sp. EM1]|eukprot:CCW60773.1 unnamed protein product [Phytomonas sp. isolate EM1]
MFSKLITQLLAEFLGTFFLLLTIPLASHGVATLSPLAIGFILSAMSFSLRHICGAHFNPAICFAAFVNKSLSYSLFVGYVFVQIIAGFFAAVYVSSIHESKILFVGVEVDIGDIWRLALWEFIYTFALVSVVLHVSFSGQRQNDFYGLSIGMLLLSAAFTDDKRTVSLLNPAAVTGAELLSWLRGSSDSFIFFLVSWIAPMSAAFVGSIFFQMLDTKDDRVRRPTNIAMIY